MTSTSTSLFDDVIDSTVVIEKLKSKTLSNDQWRAIAAIVDSAGIILPGATIPDHTPSTSHASSSSTLIRKAVKNGPGDYVCISNHDCEVHGQHFTTQHDCLRHTYTVIKCAECEMTYQGPHSNQRFYGHTTQCSRLRKRSRLSQSKDDNKKKQRTCHTLPNDGEKEDSDYVVDENASALNTQPGLTDVFSTEIDNDTSIHFVRTDINDEDNGLTTIPNDFQYNASTTDYECLSPISDDVTLTTPHNRAFPSYFMINLTIITLLAVAYSPLLLLPGKLSATEPSVPVIAFSRDNDGTLNHALKESQSELSTIVSELAQDSRWFDGLMQQTDHIALTQHSMMDALCDETAALQTFLQHILHQHVMTSQTAIAADQSMIELQQTHSLSQLNDVQWILSDLHLSQQRFARSLEHLNPLYVGQMSWMFAEIGTAQQQTRSELSELYDYQRRALSKTQSELTALFGHQNEAFNKAHKHFDTILSAQTQFRLNVVSMLSALDKLSAAQNASFGDAANMMKRMTKNAHEAEQRVRQVLSVIMSVDKMIGLAHTYRDLQVDVGVFYIAAVIVAYIITATRRTASARLWMFAAIGTALLAERSLVHYYPLLTYEHYELACSAIISAATVICLFIGIVSACSYRHFAAETLVMDEATYS